MFIQHWLRKMFGRNHNVAGRTSCHPGRRLLEAERLEPRCVLSLITIAAFDRSTGYYPFSNLVEDSAGNLFGTTSDTGGVFGGTVYEVQKGSGTVTTLASFDGANGSGGGNLIEDSAGNLFGTTGDGGTSRNGVVFELPAGSHAITALASFTGANGSGPISGVIEDSSGNLFGTTQFGGSIGGGTVFEVKAGTMTITALWSFGYGAWGSGPSGGLAEDKSR